MFVVLQSPGDGREGVAGALRAPGERAERLDRLETQPEEDAVSDTGEGTTAQTLPAVSRGNRAWNSVTRGVNRNSFPKGKNILQVISTSYKIKMGTKWVYMEQSKQHTNLFPFINCYGCLNQG